MIGKDRNQNLISISIDNIEDILKAKSKALKVIESCENEEHLKGAKKFIKLYMDATEDMVGTCQLELELLDKTKEIC
tara:strand:- start:3783 stop:4013 length:231 start_codon:yes stop_codon:yes gene_type:complete